MTSSNTLSVTLLLLFGFLVFGNAHPVQVQWCTPELRQLHAALHSGQDAQHDEDVCTPKQVWSIVQITD